MLHQAFFFRKLQCKQLRKLLQPGPVMLVFRFRASHTFICGATFPLVELTLGTDGAAERQAQEVNLAVESCSLSVVNRFTNLLQIIPAVFE